MIEQLSKVIHEELWMPWSKGLLQDENISQERKDRWEKQCFMPYEELSEEMKELDRINARKILNALNIEYEEN